MNFDKMQIIQSDNQKRVGTIVRHCSGIDNIPSPGLETLPIITYSRFPSVLHQKRCEFCYLLALFGIVTRVMALHGQSIQVRTVIFYHSVVTNFFGVFITLLCYLFNVPLPRNQHARRWLGGDVFHVAKFASDRSMIVLYIMSWLGGGYEIYPTRDRRSRKW